MRFINLITLLLLLCISTQSYALEGAEPGKSLWGIELGSKRTAVITGLNNRLGKDTRRKSDTDKSGLISDHWVIHIGDDILRFDVLSVKGKVVQLMADTSNEQGQTNLTFAELIKRHTLEKHVYGFERDGSGWVSFYYDDIKRGICFALGVQDVFLLTYHPSTLIVHRPGYTPFPIEGGIRGRPVTGWKARAYENQEEADKAEEHDTNDY